MQLPHVTNDCLVGDRFGQVDAQQFARRRRCSQHNNRNAALFDIYIFKGEEMYNKLKKNQEPSL